MLLTIRGNKLEGRASLSLWLWEADRLKSFRARQKRRYGVMTVADLKEILEEFDDDSQVLIAEQPNYPLVDSVKGVVRLEWEEDGDYNEYLGGAKEALLILEGKNLGYGSDQWWQMPLV